MKHLKILYRLLVHFTSYTGCSGDIKALFLPPPPTINLKYPVNQIIKISGLTTSLFYFVHAKFQYSSLTSLCSRAGRAVYQYCWWVVGKFSSISFTKETFIKANGADADDYSVITQHVYN